MLPFFWGSIFYLISLVFKYTMMFKRVFITGLFIFCITVFSFFTQRQLSPAEAVKKNYLEQVLAFKQEAEEFKMMLTGRQQDKLQQQFIKIRLAYKRMETIVEYYFNFFAVKLNGPPIPFFEEDEPDIGHQEPLGMQVIEELLFPTYNKNNEKQLTEVIDRLLSDTGFMYETNESNAFNDELIFDAVTEELYRITAMGITGFDSQSAVNGLPECGAALEGVEKILLFYQQDMQHIMGDKTKKIHAHIGGAQQFLKKHANFNTFPRMPFILDYLNPVTVLLGEYKAAKEFGENRSPMFYSTIKKNNGLFAPGIFDVNKYLDDNSTSADKIRFGKKLFFDTQLSVDNKRSCASCHDPKKAFTDGLRTSLALDGHTRLPRNAPTLWNAALQRNLFLVLNNANEMHGSAQNAAEKIINQPEYAALYAKAYPAGVKTTEAQNICNAIACYERTLIALNSRFDKHMRGKPQLNQDEINGFNLFMGKAKCGTCHFMPLFSGAKPPRYYYIETEVIGVPDKNTKTRAQLDEDKGRFINTNLPIHKFAFKTSTLRNISLTAPYMHNGVFDTLEQVLDFYDKGGGKGLNIAPANQTLPFEKLNLSKTEQRQIISFLKTLTDTSGLSGNY
jgi:cytochrome c peroxidase